MQLIAFRSLRPVQSIDPVSCGYYTAQARGSRVEARLPPTLRRDLEHVYFGLPFEILLWCSPLKAVRCRQEIKRRHAE